MKYYIIFLNHGKVVSISSFDDYESQQKSYSEMQERLNQLGFDWLGFPQVEYDEIQTLSEVY